MRLSVNRRITPNESSSLKKKNKLLVFFLSFLFRIFFSPENVGNKWQENISAEAAGWYEI